MKVFISWSGENSHKIASALHDWLPYIIQAIRPFMSSEGIFKGERWSEVLTKELEDTQFGIICVTPSNIKAPWLNFEAGALSKSVDRSFLFPFLSQINPHELEGPLALFQSTIFSKEDIFNLITSINERLEPAIRLDLALLRYTFETWWPQLERALRQATQMHESTTGYDWLYKPSDVSPLQLSANCKSIWVVVPLMRQALQTTCGREVVEKNIDRGIKYRFIFPRSAPGEIHAARESLWRSFEERSAAKEIYEIDLDEFKKLAVTHFLILNPKLNNNQYPLRVLLELPVVGHHHWIEVDEEAAYEFVERFDKMCAESGREL